MRQHKSQQFTHTHIHANGCALCVCVFVCLCVLKTWQKISIEIEANWFACIAFVWPRTRPSVWITYRTKKNLFNLNGNRSELISPVLGTGLQTAESVCFPFTTESHLHAPFECILCEKSEREKTQSGRESRFFFLFLSVRIPGNRFFCFAVEFFHSKLYGHLWVSNEHWASVCTVYTLATVHANTNWFMARNAFAAWM